MDLNQDLVMWASIVGFLSPLIVSIIQQPKFNDAAKAVITFLYCLVTSFITVILEGRFTQERFVTCLLFVFVTAMTAYRGLWRPTGVSPAIESATTLPNQR